MLTLKINSSFNKYIKRIMDVVCSSILLVVLSPVFIIIYLLIAMEGGDVIFGNKRIGQYGNEFSCLKFRTMVPNAENILNVFLENNPEVNAIWKTHRKIQNDPRITNIGSFLRKSSLDELPQLINVFKGEMSIVGPRPILRDEVEFFNAEQLAAYYSVKPGITGLWQVSGRNNVSFKGRVELDTSYIQNWSVWNDITIIFKTISVVINRKGVY